MDKSSSSSITTAFGTEPHQLKLGRSFDRDRHQAFHTIRYDFKPASVDHSKEAILEVGEGHEVNITLPNVESKGTTCTKFKGSKKPLQKECVLIYDHRTGEFTLERLTCNMQVKKQREEGTNKPQLSSRPLSSLDPSNLRNSPNLSASTSSKSKKSYMSSTNTVLSAPDTEQGGEISRFSPPHLPLHPTRLHINLPLITRDSDSSSSYITDSDSDDNDANQSSRSSSSDEEDQQTGSQSMRNGTLHSRHSNHGNRLNPPPRSDSPPRAKHLNSSQENAQYLRSQLSQDLQLSESDSDSN